MNLTSEEASENPAAGDLPLATRVVRGGTVVALSSYALVLFGFVCNLFLTRILSPTDYGVFALGVFFFSLIELRPKLGLETAFGQRPSTNAESAGTFAVLMLSSGIGTVLLSFLAIPVLFALGTAAPVVWVTVALAFVGLVDALKGIPWVQLDKALMFSRVSLVTAVTFPLSYVPAFWIALHGGGYWSLVALNATYSLLLLAGLWWSLRRYLPQSTVGRWAFSRVFAIQFLRFGVVVGLATVGATILFQFDNFLVGSIVNLAMAGFYTRAYSIAQWPSVLVSDILRRTAFYAYSQLQNDAVRLTRTATMSLWMITTLALPLALGIFVAAPDLVIFLFGERWLPSAIFVRYLVTYSVLRPLLDDATSLFIAVGHPGRTTRVIFAQACALFLAATPLTFRLGAEGTAIGVGVAFVVGLVVTYYYVRRTLPDLSFSQAFVVPTVATATALAVFLLFAHVFDLNGIALLPRVLLKMVFAPTLYLAATLLLRPRLTIERAEYVWRLFRNQAA